MYVYYIAISVASYMFRLPIVAIYREVFFEGILHGTFQEVINVKCYCLSKSVKFMLEYKIMIKLFVLDRVFICRVR
jgi:hypothetical protein